MDRTTRIVACLSWHAEQPAHLTRAITSLHGIADTVVALSGRWDGFPPIDTTWTVADELTAIRQTCEATSLRLHLCAGLEWRSQVDKRDQLMRCASELGDWLLVIDADEWLEPADGEGDLLRDLLGNITLRDVATVMCTHHGDGQPTSAPIRRIYRAPVTVAKAHNGYLTPDGRWLHGAPHAVQLEPTITTPLQLHHHPRNRGDERNRAAASYRAHRRRNQTERWIPE